MWVRTPVGIAWSYRPWRQASLYTFACRLNRCWDSELIISLLEAGFLQNYITQLSDLYSDRHTARHVQSSFPVYEKNNRAKIKALLIMGFSGLRSSSSSCPSGYRICFWPYATISFTVEKLNQRSSQIPGRWKLNREQAWSPSWQKSFLMSQQRKQ